jgi:hypothetical protein
MAIQGSLRDLGIIEVLQLLAAQDKTGVLRLNGDQGRHALVFERGQVVSAWDPHVIARDPFREFLIRREIVPRDEMSRVLKAETSSPHSFAELVLRLRIVEHDEMLEAFVEHIQERIEEMLAWDRGSFEFFPQESVARYAPGLEVKTEGLLMEAARRADEARDTDAPSPTEAAPAKPAEAPRAPAWMVLAHTTLLALILTGSLFGFAWFAPREAGSGPPGPAEALAARVTEIRHDRDLVALRCALEMYRHLHGRYPEKVDDLSTDGLIARDEIRALRGLRLLYQPLDDGRAFRLDARSASDIVRRPPRAS